ncbi:MarR family winged helix-turn-helix transcriptional regulator [Nocardioides sp.]|uniref:MarR family winged helix-turn-helix transcriptional regulator n=1 Tax=Nocardioides sp. TaxID=35761 RepID=UPI002D801EED|nr:MarR family transcriptional regulator [Nocardioides sp.]HET8959048.1 MarR family transcriptional regulator [Nocardioides sp.]
MNDSSASSSPRSAEEHAGLPSEALQTSTLLALRELLDVAGRVGPTVARRASLSHTELQTLELLFEGPMGPADLARRLGVSTAASSGIVDRLTARGHVVRVPHESDRRRTHVTITESGAAEIIGHLTPMFTALHELDSGLDDQQRQVVETYLRGAITALRRLLA